jgi:hypothetical protein
MIVTDEFGRIWKEIFIAYFMGLSQNLSERFEENHGKPVTIPDL